MVLTKIPGSLITDASITSADITDSTITNAKMAVDPANASNLSSGDVPLAQLGNVPAVDLSGQSADIALLAFKTQANGNLARYNLVDQSVDAFEDASGVNSGASTGASRNAAGKYYSGVGSVTATGGTITTDGDYTVHKFTADGTFTTDTAQSVEYLVVAGGGGSGCQRASDGGSGGGGAGGYRAATGFPVTATSYSITVGAGGARGIENSPAENGVDGGNSVFSTITAEGGGGGGTNNSGGGAGGSGGGGGSDGGGGAGNSPSTSPAQGFPGGASGAGATAAGGGGASAAGGAAVSSSAPGGAGGAGIANDIVLDGTPVTYAGGGGGGKGQSSPGSGGAGGAGGGGDGSKTGEGGAGTANTGGGAGGSGDGGNQQGAPGGSGIVVIRRPTTGGIADMTLVSNSQTAQAQPTKADVVLTYTNGAGTAVVNTDLIASVSRDDGTNYTAVTLASQGTTGGHTILTANDVDISGQPAGTSMVWKVATTSQSAAKETRIQAVSLGWS